MVENTSALDLNEVGCTVCGWHHSRLYFHLYPGATRDGTCPMCGDENSLSLYDLLGRDIKAEAAIIDPGTGFLRGDEGEANATTDSPSDGSSSSS